MSKKEENTDSTFPAKYEKVLKEIPEFRDSVAGMSVAEIKQSIVTCESHVSEVETSKSNDPNLEAARTVLKEMQAPYADSLKVLQAKIRFLIYTLEERGVDASASSEEKSE